MGRGRGTAVQAVRVLRIVKLLENTPHGFSMTTLAELFGVRLKQISSDLDAIEEAGFNVVRTNWGPRTLMRVRISSNVEDVVEPRRRSA